MKNVMKNSSYKLFNADIVEFTCATSRAVILYLQSFTKYLRLTLVFIWNSALREKFNFCFLKGFC